MYIGRKGLKRDFSLSPLLLPTRYNATSVLLARVDPLPHPPLRETAGYVREGGKSWDEEKEDVRVGEGLEGEWRESSREA